MFAGVKEEYKFLCIFSRDSCKSRVLVILFLKFLHFGNKCFKVVYLLVVSYFHFSALQEVSEDDSFNIEYLFFFDFEFVELFRQYIFKVFSILFINKSVMENSHVFIVPESDDDSLVIAIFL